VKKLLNMFLMTESFFLRKAVQDYPLCLFASDTVSLFLPLARRPASTLLPLADSMRVLKPCLFLLFLLEGWNVLFMTRSIHLRSAKLKKTIFYAKPCPEK
jgi:hypothetical protein